MQSIFSSDFIIQVASQSDLDLIYQFSKSQFLGADAFVEWSAPWRKESLQHYLNSGWSMWVKRQSDQEIVGYFLGQPFLFFAGQTQSLWVEAVAATSTEIAVQIVDLALRLSREKHLQRVLLNEKVFWTPKSLFSQQDLSRSDWFTNLGGLKKEDAIIEFRTTKG